MRRRQVIPLSVELKPRFSVFSYHRQSTHHFNHRFRDDSSVGVIILTGKGTGAFCSGGDQALRNKDGYADYENIGRPNVPDVQVLTDYMKTRYPLDPVCSATGKTTISAPAKAPTSRGPTPPPPP
ncbi:hypothetical protein Vadar_028410 [Vaccinium darrowii]|uniref:Uncharacterized protein n=1 Tax=Vaccinium darrowii TaxID=229202 RepID=A0ACB7YRF0_9ERIC|nr:hypothetical protein Vadar_028410 [Vaccinium darrowii]